MTVPSKPLLTTVRLQQLRTELEYPATSLEAWVKVQELLLYLEGLPEFSNPESKSGINS